MDKFDRTFHLDTIPSACRTPIPLEDLARVECSKSTLHRTVHAHTDYLNAPVVFDADAGGYKYESQEPGSKAHELAGFWFTPSEPQALAVMQRLLKDAGGGLLEERLNLGEPQSRLREQVYARSFSARWFTAYKMTRKTHDRSHALTPRLATFTSTRTGDSCRGGKF